MSDNVLGIIVYKNEDGKRFLVIRGYGEKYKEFYKTLIQNKITWEHADFP